MTGFQFIFEICHGHAWGTPSWRNVPTKFQAWHSEISTWASRTGPRRVVYIHTSIHPSIRPSVRPSIHSFIHSFQHTYVPTYIHSYIHSYIHACMHACMHAYIHTYIHKGRYLHKQSAYIYMCICIHTNIILST